MTISFLTDFFIGLHYILRWFESMIYLENIQNSWGVFSLFRQIPSSNFFTYGEAKESILKISWYFFYYDFCWCILPLFRPVSSSIFFIFPEVSTFYFQRFSAVSTVPFPEVSTLPFPEVSALHFQVFPKVSTFHFQRFPDVSNVPSRIFQRFQLFHRFSSNQT